MQMFADSLWRTVDAVNEAIFFGTKLSPAERSAAARLIASRQGLAGSYAETFRGFDAEFKTGIQLFTGERIVSASARHILGEECCRALRLLKVRDGEASAALKRADLGLRRCMDYQASLGRDIGWFCCGKCSVGMWRNVLAGGLDHQEKRLERGVMILKRHRDARHGWKRFPFWYTVLALAEMKSASALAELKHAATVLERTAKSKARPGTFAARRHTLAERALALIG